MNVNSKMTALANGIRELSGITAPKSIDTMTSDINVANTEIAEQAELLEQIAIALEDKASGSGGITLPTLSDPATASDILSGKEAVDSEGNVLTGTIVTRTSGDISFTGATARIPAGYYASQTAKTISSGTAETPATTITKPPTISVTSSGIIIATVDGTQSVTPTVTAGYVSHGTAGTITVSGSNTRQLETKAAKTITPTTSTQLAVGSGVYTTGAITVAAIPSNYEDVGTETSEYTTKIASLEMAVTALETELAGKASGGSSGGGVATCTVKIVNQCVSKSLGYIQYIYTRLDNGVITSAWYDGIPVIESETIFENVVCGSAFYLYMIGDVTMSLSCSDGVSVVDEYSPNIMGIAPSDSGVVGIITIEDDD